MGEAQLAFGDENDIAKAIREAIGVGDFERVDVILPQFERTDGKVITYFPEDAAAIDALREKASDDLLESLGLQVFDQKDGELLWLFPGEWYKHIPAGYEIEDICHHREPFEPGKTDDDIRGGALAYGFSRAPKSEVSR